MGTSLQSRRESANEIDRSDLQNDEENFGSMLGDVARLLWPTNTAPEVAALVGCSVRNIEQCLSGRQKWSGDALAIIVGEILKRHKMRNVRVVARPK